MKSTAGGGHQDSFGMVAAYAFKYSPVYLRLPCRAAIGSARMDVQHARPGFQHSCSVLDDFLDAYRQMRAGFSGGHVAGEADVDDERIGGDALRRYTTV